MRAVLFAAVFALTPWPAARADFVGKVVRVADGDTLTVLMERKQVRVRLDAIDAPELKQPFGQRAQQSLAELCTARSVRVMERGMDRYGRVIGRIECDGVEANSEQVRRGLAWVSVRFAPPNSPLYGLQGEAQRTRRGLWADPRPVAPWDWRASASAR